MIFPPGAHDIGRGLGFLMLVVSVVMISVIGTAILFIDAAIVNAVQKAPGGTGTYEGTVRFVLYSTAATSLLWIPLAGGIFAIYQMYLYAVGGRFVHEVSLKRSAQAVFISFLLIIVFIMLIGLSGLV